jgi:cytoskeletal protein CcmA (bactofilin family)
MFRKDDEEKSKAKEAPAEISSIRQTSDPERSILGPDLTIIGNIECKDDLEIQGRVEGDIKSRHLTLSETARVDGSVIADAVQLMGSIKGQVKASSVNVAKTGKVTGDVTYQTMSMEEGAVIEGNCQLIGPEKAVENAEILPMSADQRKTAAKGGASAGSSPDTIRDESPRAS